MEIINNNDNEKREPNRFIKNAYIGVLLILIGVVWLLYNLDAISYTFFDVFFSWQMLLIAIGGYLLSVKKWLAGLITGSVGVIFMLTKYFDIDIPINKIILPAAIIVIGVVFLLQKK